MTEVWIGRAIIMAGVVILALGLPPRWPIRGLSTAEVVLGLVLILCGALLAQRWRRR